jgi:hypothetical protein
LLLKNGKTMTFPYAQASTSTVALKVDLFEALHEHTHTYALQLAGELPKSPDKIVFGAAAPATSAVNDGDGRAAVRMWYSLDRQDTKKATVNHVGIGLGDTVAWRWKDKEFDV